MKDIPTRNYVIEIPIYWTAAQADAVFEFLSIIATAVFDNYDNEITEIARHQHIAARIDELNHDDDEEEDFLETDLPF